MNRLSSAVGTLGWRQSRWLLCAAVIPALWACNSRKLGSPAGQPAQVVQTKVLQSQNRKLDLIFMIDDSLSMKPLQDKLARRLPDFTASLGAIAGGLPDLHLAIVSSSLGAGNFGDVPGCMSGPPGDQGGRFQHKANCGLNADANFIKASADGSTNNFTGNLDTVFSCIAALGDGGCGFEHQFESTRQAIIKSLTPNDPDNGGFWRDDAFLGIIMLTNEDDCSVPIESELFNTSMSSVADQLGPLWSYRCNEFGHACDQPMPHGVAGLPMTLTGCHSKENTDGKFHLTPVADFVKFMNQVKTPDKTFVAIIGGPADPYTVGTRNGTTAQGMAEVQPEIKHSCMATDGTYADPGVRLIKFVNDMAGIFLPICAADFQPALKQIGDTLGKRLGVQCINGNVTPNAAGAPDCDVTLRTTTSGSAFEDKKIPFCDAGTTSGAGMPCWNLAADPKCPNGQVLKICYDSACNTTPMSAQTVNALVSCALKP